MMRENVGELTLKVRAVMARALVVLGLVFALPLFSLPFTSSPAYANCTSPAGVEGEQIYNSTYKVMQFCNGSDWLSMDASAIEGGLDNMGDHSATQALDMNSNRITDVTDPSGAQDAATKAYVDSNSSILRGLSCSSDEVASWNGSAWACSSIADADTLSGLSCSNNEIAKYDGSAWACAAISGGTSTNSNYTLTFTPGSAASSGDIDNVFNTDLYTGNGGSQTITNNIDLSGQGGLVWFKARSNSGAPYYNFLYDTERDPKSTLSTEFDIPQFNNRPFWIDYNSDGFSFDGTHSAGPNQSGISHAAWTFRESSKFFDIVTWTGDGNANRKISHNLGATPGMIIIKSTSTSADWLVYHRGVGNNRYLTLNSNGAQSNNTGWMEYTNPTSTEFTTAANGNGNNDTGVSYIAYVFAHDTSTDGVIQCGSYNASSSDSVTLGWTPQWLLIKNVDSASSGWYMFNSDTGLPDSGAGAGKFLLANTSNGEANDSAGSYFYKSSTGFGTMGAYFTSGHKIAYCAIRAVGGSVGGSAATNATITDTASAGTLGGLLTSGTNFNVSGTASNNGTFSSTNVVNANTIEVSQSLVSEASVSATITTVSGGGSGGLDTLSNLTCTNGQVAAWNGVTWACSAQSDTLGDLSCSNGELAAFDGTSWGCTTITASVSGGGGSNYTLNFTPPTNPGWTATGTPQAISLYEHDIEALDSDTVAVFTSASSSQLTTFDWNGSSWTQVGSAYSIPSTDVAYTSITKLDSSTVAVTYYENNASKRNLETYSWNGSAWSKVGSSLNVTGAGIPHVAALDSTTVAYIDSNNDQLRTYGWNGSNWSLVGSALGVTVDSWIMMESLDANTVVIAEHNTDRLQTYTWNGSSWSSTGSAFSIANFGSAMGVERIDSSNIIVAHEGTNEIIHYRWNGSTWSEISKDGTALQSLSLSNGNAATLLDSTTLVVATGNDDNLRVYSNSGGDGARISDAASGGTLGGLLTAGTNFNISGTVSNDGLFSSINVVDANTIEVSQTVSSESGASANIVLSGSGGGIVDNLGNHAATQGIVFFHVTGSAPTK